MQRQIYRPAADIFNARYLLCQYIWITDSNKKDLKEFFGKYLTFCEENSLDSEIVRWKRKFADVPLKQKPKTACDAAAKCDATFYPVIKWTGNTHDSSRQPV
ncbi:Hypothetical predicted protein, partial [Paramuricea clavata]